MLVVEGSVGHHEVSLVVVRRLVEEAVGPDEAGLEENASGRGVGDGELYVRLVEVAQLRRERVAEVLVRDDNVGGERVAALDSITAAAQRRDELLFDRPGGPTPDGEDVYAHHVRLQELRDGVELLRELV